MIKQFVPQEVCLKCQGCCRFSQKDSLWSPTLLHEEVQGLLKNKIPPLFISCNNKIRLLQMSDQDNFVCSFFSQQENRCKIYLWRPFECQLYPFLINHKNKKVYLAVDLHCAFVEKELNTPQFEKYVSYLTEFLNSPSQTGLFKKNPQIIQRYPEVLNLNKLKI